MSIVETVEWLETLIRIPVYATIGSTKDRLVYLSSEDGTLCLCQWTP